MMRAVRDNLLFILALAAGALCLLVSLSDGGQATRFAEGARDTHGTIVRTWQDEATNRHGTRTLNWVEVAFEDARGRRYAARAKLAEGVWSALAAGMEMPVTYLEADPATNFIGTQGSSTLSGPALALAFACFAAAILQVWRSLAVPPTRTLAGALNDASEGDIAAIFARRTS